MRSPRKVTTPAVSADEAAAKLERYRRMCAEVKPFKCEHCSFRSRNTSQIEEHRKSHELSAREECGLCGRMFLSSKRLMVHMGRAHRNSLYACPADSRKFLTEPELLEHLSAHPNKIFHECTERQAEFMTATELYKHIKTDKCNNGDENANIARQRSSSVETENASNTSDTSFDIVKDAGTMDDDRDYKDDAGNIDDADSVESENEYTERKGTQSAFDLPPTIDHDALEDTAEGEMLQCEMCPLKLGSTLLLKNHMDLHRLCFWCLLCNQLLSHARQVSGHMRRIHNITNPIAKSESVTFVRVNYSDLVKANRVTENGRFVKTDKNLKASDCAPLLKTKNISGRTSKTNQTHRSKYRSKSVIDKLKGDLKNVYLQTLNSEDDSKPVLNECQEMLESHSKPDTAHEFKMELPQYDDISSSRKRRRMPEDNDDKMHEKIKSIIQTIKRQEKETTRKTPSGDPNQLDEFPQVYSTGIVANFEHDLDPETPEEKKIKTEFPVVKIEPTSPEEYTDALSVMKGILKHYQNLI